MACLAEVGSLQYMSQSRPSMCGELLITPDTRSCKQECQLKQYNLYAYINTYPEVGAGRFYKSIEGSGFEMVKMIRPFLARNINKKRHINMVF